MERTIMTDQKTIGTFTETRGDDTLTVTTDNSGKVIAIKQYDAIGHRSPEINFWTVSAPTLIKLIQKAAKLGPEKEQGYVYAVEETDEVTGNVKIIEEAETPEDIEVMKKAFKIIDKMDTAETSYRLVRRPTVSEWEAVVDA